MKSDATLKRQGAWTSYVQRLVNRFRKELISELGEEPRGTKRALLDSTCQKYAILTIMGRELRERQIIVNGELVPMLSRSFLAWQASFERSLQQLTGNGKPEAALLDGIAAIDSKFATPEASDA